MPAIRQGPLLRLRFPLQTRQFSVTRSLSKTAEHKYTLTPDTPLHVPAGFTTSSLACGIKKGVGALDLSLLHSALPCNAAGSFTQNHFRAAPVEVCKDILAGRNGEGIRAVLTNSGNANSVTGRGGMQDALMEVEAVDTHLGDGSGSLVMSTGVIGKRLPIDNILKYVPQLFKTLDDSFEAWSNTSKAMMTTDKYPKLRSRSWTAADGTKRNILGMVKGAGMIHPRLSTPGVEKKELHATLLGVFLTDAPISSSHLRQVLDNGVQGSFNCISVDGDTSTNDTILLLANGASGGSVIAPGSEDDAAFQKALHEVMLECAHLIVRDGEGATKLVKVSVQNWNSKEEARNIAESIAVSPLVKTAIYGRDANWGRIICAVGNTVTGVEPDLDAINVSLIGGGRTVKMLEHGQPTDWSEEEALKILNLEELEVRVDMGAGTEHANYWTCDLTHEYISINADYRT